MRILLTADTVGGVWDYAVTLSRALARRGHAVLLAAVGSPGSAQLARLPEAVAVEARDQPLEWLPASYADLRVTAEWLSTLAGDWDADLVHLSQMTCPGLIRFPAPTVVTVHSDVLSWHSEVRGTPAPPEWAGYGRAVAAGLRAAGAVVAPTRYQADLVLRHFGRSVDRVIHNGAPTVAASVRTGASVLLSAGRAWDEGKGFKLLDEALLLLGDAAPPAHLLGELEPPGGGDGFTAVRLACHGSVDRDSVDRWMSRAAIFVAPSLYEPFGLAPLEAATQGCALVLSDIGSFRELWNGCGRFFRKGSARGLADSIAALAGDPDAVTELGRSARERALVSYGEDGFVEDHLALYARLLRGDPVATDDRRGQSPWPPAEQMRDGASPAET